MKKAYLALACVLLAPMLLVGVSSSATYDPWVDLDADGDIDIFDVVTLAGSYQTTGDPTKSVNVLNWPVTTQQTVWHGQASSASSSYYNASGFGHMHLTWLVSNLVDPESVTLIIWVQIYNPATHLPTSFTIQSVDITRANDRGSLSFPVPAETFRFQLTFATGTEAYVYLAFYLTYA